MQNKILVYDDNCPLCCWYSSLFVKAGLLPATGRTAFSTLEPAYLAAVDFNRGRNEIPLLDTTGAQTLYGIDALLEILGEKCPWLKSIGRKQPVYWLLKKFYKLISYNRKVIVAKKCGMGKIDCAPELNYFYRYLFMVFILLLNSLLLIPIFHLLRSGIPGFWLSMPEFQTTHAILVAINITMACWLSRAAAVEYLGQVTVLALISTGLLLPLCVLSCFIQPDSVLCLVYFGLAAIVVFHEYIRRMQYCGLLDNNQWMAGIGITAIMSFVVYVLR